MAAPTFVDAGTGATDAGGDWSYTCQAAGAAGRLFIVHTFYDGTTGTYAVTGASNIENLAGTDNAWTMFIGAFPVGDASAGGSHRLYIGRSLTTAAPTISGTNTTSEDLYIRSYQFDNVATGTTVEDIIENGTAGGYVTSNGTTNFAGFGGDAVTTLGPDRLALAFVAVNDDNAIAEFTGETGGDWVEAVAEYAESSGTDGAVGLMKASMSTAGTISGGGGSITDVDAWGIVGFALIGTTVAASKSLLPPMRYHLIRR